MASLHSADHGYWLAVHTGCAYWLCILAVHTVGSSYSKHGLLALHVLQSIAQYKEYHHVAD